MNFTPKSKSFLPGLIIIIFLLTWSVIYKFFYSPDYVKFKTIAFGTYVEITYPRQEKEKTIALEQEILKTLADCDQIFSVYKAQSLVSQLNQTGQTKAHPFLVAVIKEARKVSEISQGAFDISLGPLIKVWQKADKEQKFPTDKELKAAKALVDYRCIEIHENKILLTKKGMNINLGGIAKGFVIDLIAEKLRKRYIYNCLINIGGDLRAVGIGPKYKGWVIAIRHPRKQKSYLQKVRLRNQAIATSGDYARYSIIEGKRISHLIDPRTAEIVLDLPASVTVIAPTALQADALATAVYILGKEQGMQLVNSLSDVAILIVNADGEKFFSQSWKNF